MLKSLLTAAALLLCSANLASAQDMGGMFGKALGNAMGKNPMTMTERLVKSLDSLKLSDEQKGKLTVIYDKYEAKRAEKTKPLASKIKTAQEINEAEILKALREEWTALNAQLDKDMNPALDKEIDAVFTAEQRDRYKKLLEEREKHHQEVLKKMEEFRKNAGGE